MRKCAALIIAGALLAGCAIGPNYQRPAVDIPEKYRGPGTEGSAAGQTASIGDQKWWEVFQDKQLQELINTALAQNYDVRIAADQILQAQEQLTITGSYQYPTVNLGAGPISQRFEKVRTTGAYEWGSYQLTGSLSWDIDFWGKYRRMIEAAKAGLLASQWAREEVISTLVADVASAYFQLCELDTELKISQDTLNDRRASLRLTQQLADHGSASMLDVRQAEQLVYTAAANITDTERRIQQQENLINVLLGNNPGGIKRGLLLTQQPHAPEVPAGIPSSLLERRPDILQAEELLIASNAQIGIAQGAYFPDISLTGTGGYQSAALSQLFNGQSGMWDIAAQLTQPIFTAGRIKAGVKLAKAQEQQALHTYLKTIQEAFREVSDALIAYRRAQEFTSQQELLTNASQDAVRLSNLRYKGGTASYLEVLESDTTYYSAELGLAQARLNELQTLVDVYKALGGGWKT